MPRVGLPLAYLLAGGFLISPLSFAAHAQSAPQGTEKSAPAKRKSEPKKKPDAKSGAAAGETAAGKADPAVVQKHLDAAEKAYEAGKFDVAVTQTNALMALTGLDARSTARALMLRGQAYQKQGKPAQAIADLQSALWLKGGLNDSERGAAQQARVVAYKEAGLPEPQAIGGSAPKTAAPAPGTSNVQTASTLKPVARPEVPVVAAAEPAKPAAPATGNFFSNLFGGSSAAPPAKPAAAPAPPPAAVSSSPPVVVGPPAKASRTAATPAEPQPAALVVAPTAKAAPAAGRFRLQLGAVRSRDEARAMAAKIKQEHGTTLGERRYDIDETVFGNMGTFYRVQIGAFADLEQSKSLCATLRTKGFDCMVVSQ